MSWIGEHVTRLEEWAKDLIGHADTKVHAIGEDLARVAGELRGDAPKLADEAKTDAEQVIATAETQGVQPAVVEADTDAVRLAQDAVHDVAAALEGSNKPAEPAHTPAQTAAVIAGETAVASEQPAA